MTAQAGITITLIVTVVFLVTRITGFGGALIGVPLISLVVGPRTAVVAAVVLGIVSTGYLAITLRALIDRPVLRRTVPGVLVGLVPGAVILRIVDEDTLRAMLAVAVVGGATLVLRQRNRPPLDLPNWVDTAAGGLAGALTTSLSTNGPPIVVLLQARGLEPEPFRATLSATFVSANIVGVALLGASGQLVPDVWWTVAVALPGLAVGQYLGLKLARRVPKRFFPTIVAVMLCASVVSITVGIVRS